MNLPGDGVVNSVHDNFLGGFGPDRRRDSGKLQVSKELLERIWDYLSEREDVKDGDDGRPRPNEAMSILMDLKKEVGDLSPPPDQTMEERHPINQITK